MVLADTLVFVPLMDNLGRIITSKQRSIILCHTVYGVVQHRFGVVSERWQQALPNGAAVTLGHLRICSCVWFWIHCGFVHE
jgi:hypothetical protein